jgi:Ferritin-like
MPEPAITPRNLTARAAHRVVGNPATSRPEDAVANCFPGLELDVRNLDRRFFPGLVFDYVARDDIYADYDQPDRYGARLAFIDLVNDPDVQGSSPLAVNLMNQLQGNAGTLLATGDWYIEWIEQGERRISMSSKTSDGRENPLDGLYVWRIIRGLEPLQRSIDDSEHPVTLRLRCRSTGRESQSVELKGWRRRFTDPETGVISLAYQPGELLQSLCSPWQHDFRDCGCHYWAANHPDVVTGEVLPGESLLPDGAANDPLLANTPLDWLRADRSRDMAGAMANDVVLNRPFQMDHYQINHTWQQLDVVIQGAEVGAVYTPPEEAQARPYETAEEMATVIRTQLAPIELTLALEYLYARSSVVDPSNLPPGAPATLFDDAVFIRHYVLLTAVSEMLHLRFANQLLWALFDSGRISEPYVPVLTPSPKVPAPNRRERWRPAELRPLTIDALDDFITIEHPRADLDHSWSRVVATLREPSYPPHFVELAERIAKDGNDHYSRYREIRSVLRSTYGGADPAPWLRPLHPASAREGADAIAAYHVILDRIRAAYDRQMQGHFERSGPLVVEARAAMDRLLAISESLGASGLGVPYWTDA